MITNLNSGAEAFLANTERIQRKIAEASQQASSGLRVSSASDAPDEIHRILQIRTNSVHNAQVQSNLAMAKSDADAADGALSSAVKLLERARVLGAQGSNFTMDAAGRTSIAVEVESLLDQLVAISRTTVQSRYVFGGDDEDTPPYQVDLTTVDGVTRLTTAGSTRRIEDPAGVTFAGGKTAAEIFDAPGSSAFAALNGLRTALLNNDSAGIQAAGGSIRTAGDQLGGSQAFYGGVQNRIQDAVNFGQSYDVRLKTELGAKVDADLTEAALAMTQGNIQLQAAFQMQAKLPRTTLFDFLG